MTPETPAPDVHGIARAVALCLGAEWAYKSEPLAKPGDTNTDREWRRSRADVVRTARDRAWGAAVHFSWSSYEKKLTVSGEFPHNYRPHRRSSEPELVLSIGVSPTKPATQIARDIERRLLSGYLPAYIDAITRKADDERKKVIARRNVSKIAAAAAADDPTKDPRKCDQNRTYDDWHLWGDGCRIRLSSYRPEQVEVEQITTDVETALAICRLLRKAKQRQRETA